MYNCYILYSWTAFSELRMLLISYKTVNGHFVHSCLLHSFYIFIEMGLKGLHILVEPMIFFWCTNVEHSVQILRTCYSIRLLLKRKLELNQQNVGRLSLSNFRLWHLYRSTACRLSWSKYKQEDHAYVYRVTCMKNHIHTYFIRLAKEVVNVSSSSSSSSYSPPSTSPSPILRLVRK